MDHRAGWTSVPCSSPNRDARLGSIWVKGGQPDDRHRDAHPGDKAQMETWIVRCIRALDRRRGWCVVLFAALLGCNAQGEGTQMGKFDRLVLFSRVQGVVLDHGVPVPGAQLSQKIVWSDDDAENTEVRTHTDARGHFGFEAITHSAGITRLVPHAPMILQTIRISHAGQDYVAWKHGKQTYDDNSELGGKPILLVCDLSNAPEQVDYHYGICRVASQL